MSKRPLDLILIGIRMLQMILFEDVKFQIRTISLSTIVKKFFVTILRDVFGTVQNIM